jgi:hypothetical protein
VRHDRVWLQLADVREHLPHRAIVADYAARTDRTVERLLDVQQAHPLVGVPLADRCPTQRFTARWRDLLDDTHWFILNLFPGVSSFLAINDGDGEKLRRGRREEVHGRAGAEVAQRSQDKHLHDSRGVTVEEMHQTSMAFMRLVPIEPTAALKKVGIAVGTSAVGTGNRMRNDVQRPRLSRRAA